ncbi:MAG: alpha/beta hydrolase [Acutalibacteraceae bacterium]
MAQFDGTVYSASLGMMTAIAVSLPAEGREQPGGLPVLYLLHGLSDNHSCWLRRTAVDRYAEEYGIAVVMPEVQRSFYCDMAHGPAYFTYIADELPQICQRLFRLSDKREDTFIAGNSMGGYGALKAALSRPERFAAAAGFSSAADVRCRPILDTAEGYAIHGGELRDRDDLFYLTEKAARQPDGCPRLYMTCGLADFLYEDNQKFRAHVQTLGLPLTYEEWEGGHTWDFWDASVRRAMAFFMPPENKEDAR